MKVSIALATYNGAKYLSKQLDSFVNQTVLPDELIISDDHSEDDTLEIAESFKKKAPFDVRILRSEYNAGFVKNFEKAIKHTTGELIFLSDQDDIWFANKIETVKNKFRANPDSWVMINNQEIISEDGQPTGLNRLSQLEQVGYSNIEFKTGCCTAFRKDLKPYILPIPGKYVNHDIWIHELAHHLQKRYVIYEVLQYYRRHEKNVTSGSFKKVAKTNIFSFLSNALKIKVEDYSRNIRLLEELKDRIKEVSRDQGRPSDIITTIDEKIAAWKRRDRLAEYGLFKKRIRIVGMLLKGDYKYFRGYKSFFKDLIL